MSDANQLVHWGVSSRLILPFAVLLSPILVALRYRRKAFRHSAQDSAEIWYGYRSQRRFIVLTTLAFWWALWDFDTGFASLLKADHSWLLLQSLQNNPTLLFWIPPTACLLVTQLLNYSTDKFAAGLRWSKAALLRRACWSLVQDVFSMLMVATGFEAIYRGHYVGILWLAGASIVHRVGLVFLRLAEGVRFNRLKSGELRNRCLSMARKMGIELRSVCMVPAGKGHLTNAFGASNMIALTDALPKFLNDRQMDAVIAHELIHVKYKHTRTESAVIVISYLALALFMFRIPARAMEFRPLLDLAVVYAPMISFYYFARRAEFEADREAVLHTGDPEAAIRGLAKLYRCSSAPTNSNRFAELFHTHPALTKRVSSIALVGELSQERASKILAEAGLLTMDR